jgi:hypothetical protein
MKRLSLPATLTMPDLITMPFGNDDGEQGPKVVSPLDIPGKRRLSPLVLFFFGRRGQGKSLVMSAIAKMMQDRYRSAGRDTGLVSNYYLDFADRADPYLLDELIEFPEWAYNLLVCIDEVATAFPGRRSLAKINVLFSSFLTQIRKRRIEVMFTTQFPQVMDQQILMQVDLFIRCEAIQGGRHVRLEIYDWWGQYTGNFDRKPWPPLVGTHDNEITIFNTNTVFGAYSTNEVVANVNSDSRDALIARQWDTRESTDDAETVDLTDVPAPPQNLTEAAEAMRAKHGAFRVLEMWPDVHKFAPEIKSVPQLKTALVDLGYTITMFGNIPVAERDGD